MLTRIVLIKPKHDLSDKEFDEYRVKFDKMFQELPMVYDFRSNTDDHPLNQGYTFTALIELADRESIPKYEEALISSVKPLLGEMADHYIVTHV